MTTHPDDEDHRAIRGIEDRKVDILMEIAEINGEYDERMSRLREEYAELDTEHYFLRLKIIRGGRSSTFHRGDGEP